MKKIILILIISASLVFANMPRHLWSGWHGECYDGMKMDFSFLANPMTIMSYAMMAYSSYTQLNNNKSLLDQYGPKFGEYMDSAKKAVTDGMKSMSDSLSEITGNVASGAGDVAVGTAGSSVMESMKGMLKTASEWWDNPLVGAKTDFFKITNGSLLGFGVNSVIILATPTEEQYALANNLLKGYAGIENPDAVAFNSCMASIGLSFPNLISSSFDSNQTSAQLNEPHTNPLSLTTAQLAQIAQEFGEEWVMSSYLINTDNPQLLQVVATNKKAYIQAGQSLCTNAKVSAAMNQIQNSNTGSSLAPGGGGNQAMQIGMAAISAGCPVCGFAATVAMDLYTNVAASMDTCNDENDAFGKSILDYKTYMFLKQEQCSDVNTECSKKMFWGQCVQWRYNKCCFDQITTRVFAEGIREQLGREWGNCKLITISDLKDISFRECGVNESAKEDKCFPMNKYSEFKQVLFRQMAKGLQTNDFTSGVIDQIQNAMAIDVE